MKAILVVDTPICEECPCYHEDRSVCQAGGLYGKPCPLRPMPMKRETHVYWKSVGIGDVPTHEISDYDKGWNDCVDFLEGENESVTPNDIMRFPRVDAIPVELIKRKIEEYDRNWNYIKAEALTDLIYDWRKEND